MCRGGPSAPFSPPNAPFSASQQLADQLLCAKSILGAGETDRNITNLAQGELDRNQISKDKDIHVYFLLRGKTKQGMVIESQEAAVRVIREDFLEVVTSREAQSLGAAQEHPSRTLAAQTGTCSPEPQSASLGLLGTVTAPTLRGAVPAARPVPHLCAGGPSMMMLIHRICMALRGLGRLHTVDRVMRLKAEMLLRGHTRAGRWRLFRCVCSTCRHWELRALTYVLSWNRTKFLML